MRAVARRQVRSLLGAALAASCVLAAAPATAEAPATGGVYPSAKDGRPTLPRGQARRVFPRFRVVAYFGAPQHRALGALGIGPPRRAARRLRRQARPYRRGGRPIMPAFELIATIALAHPGADGKYRSRQPARIVGRYLRAARRARALLLLDIQPGRSGFIREARALRRWLRQPDVGLALDPEWNMGPRGVPGRTIGSVDAAKVNRLSAWLARLVERHDLPQKLLVVHQFTQGMIRRKRLMRQRRRVAVTIDVDGFGGPRIKAAKYRAFTRSHGPPRRRGRLWNGFKLFYEEDTRLLSPRRVLRLRPRPDLVVYE